MANQLIHFGKLSLLYEDGFVRYIRAGEIEILRKIYFALRDSNWATADIVRTDERISVTPTGFDISYTATNVVESNEVFRWRVKISGNESGEIEFAVDGRALAKYNRNRAGICVLHPIRDTRDKIAKVTRPDGSVYEEKFPTMIKPHQPFMDIRKMSWQLKGDAWAEIEFEGDVFETEDQRNWSDTSFKTYSTPLSIPYPVMLNPGDRVSQKVKMKLINSEDLDDPEFAEDIEVTIHDGDPKPFPKIGSEFPGKAASPEDVELMKPLHFEHIRVELVLSSPDWKSKLTAGVEEANAIEAKVFAHLIIDEAKEWDDFETYAGKENISGITRIAISPFDRKANVDVLLQYALPKARKTFPKVSIGAGFRSYFTELNRNRFDYSGVDFVIYPLNPQAHASDSLTIIENLPAEEDAVKSASALAPGKKVHVGPVSIKHRFNPDARPGTPENPEFRFDPRQQTALTAGWALASIKYLSEGGADTITLFESHGRAGYFSEGKLFPVYNAYVSLLKLKPRRVFRSSCNEPLIISSLVVEDDKMKRHLIIINHTSLKKSVTVGDVLLTLSGSEIQFIAIK